jgi:hypothetical protein
MSSGPKPSDSHIWRGKRSTPPTGAQAAAQKRRQIVTLFFVILALAGATAAWFFFLRPLARPYFVAIWIDQYTDLRIPVNAWSEQDRHDLLNIGWEEKNEFASQERHQLLDELRGLEGKKDRPVVVYLSAFAVRGEQGQIYVLPATARLDDLTSWLPLADVFRSLRDCPSRHKLLILDITHPFVEPRAGILANDIGEPLRGMVEEAVQADPHLLVLGAAGPGQVSAVAEDMRHSVLAYYVIRGLQGMADGYHPGNRPNREVSAQELVHFVAARVDRWSGRNRTVPQTAYVLGSDRDFPLVMAVDNPVPVEEPEAIPDYPGWLRAGWEVRDRWWNTTFRAAPDVFRQLEITLLRTEQQWRGGGDEGKLQRELHSEMRRLQQRHDHLVAQVPRPEPRSLALALAQGQKGADLRAALLHQKLKELAALDAQARQPKAEEAVKAKLKTALDEFLKPFEGKSFQLAHLAFENLLAEDNPRPERVLFYHSLVETIQPPPPFAETRFLQRLAGLAGSADPKDWPRNAVKDALRVVSVMEQVAAADPLRALPWVYRFRMVADRKRDEAERLLLAGDPKSWAAAEQRLPGVVSDAEQILRFLDILSQAYRQRDKARVLLPSYLPYLELADFQARYESVWMNACSTLRGLEEALVVPTGWASLPIDEHHKQLAGHVKHVKGQSDALQDNLQTLGLPFREEQLKRTLEETRNGGPAGWLLLSTLLDGPWLWAGDRPVVWKAARDISWLLHKRTVDLDRESESERRSQAAPVPFSAEKAIQQEREQALRRARWSIALLQLEGRPGVGKLEDLVQQVRKGMDKRPAWHALSRGLLEAWSRTSR